MCSVLSFLLFLSSFLRNVSVTSAASFLSHPFCHGHDRLALLQFKQSFIINSSASGSPWAYSKIESWNLQGGHGDCCTWDGVECDNSTGHVIGLDLSSSYLHGSINSNSSLFRLVHLRRLNLADNDFNLSEIPSSLGHLSKLIYLNLSSSAFSRSIPSDISKLSKLVSLDFSSTGLLMLNMPDFRMLLQNLTSLEVLDLDGINLSSTMPVSLANLSYLTSLSLQGCELYGEFPPAVFQLTNLKFLNVGENRDLRGYLPEFNSTSPLVKLALRRTSFEGELPASFGNLRSLQYFDTQGSNFSGKIPSSFENLTELVHLGLHGHPFEVSNVSSLSWLGRQSQLTFLVLHNVIIKSQIPPYIANLTQLKQLSLLDCQIYGQIPSWLSRMTQLSVLQLSSNKLQGVIPYSISQLFQLTALILSDNMLRGSIPGSIFRLGSLQLLDIARNSLSGIIEFDRFLKLQNLTNLDLSDNMLSFHAKSIPSTTHPKFVTLGLGSCNLSHFPLFLRDQQRLEQLILSDNKIEGIIPRWIWNIGHETLQVLDLSGNNFIGEIPSQFCRLNYLDFLDLSNNNLSGVLPQCLESLSATLEVLVLDGNNFYGRIPPMHPNACNLKELRLGRNQLEGQVPRSLANCTKLEILDLGNNQISDAFPSWLAVLQQLKVLVLRSNRFNGILRHGSSFPKLRIVDLSQNNFSGPLPTQVFLNWNAMKESNASRLAYMHTSLTLSMGGPFYSREYFMYQISLNNKGRKQQYDQILDFFVAMDLSGNGFRGEIPTSIENLYGLRMLNLSNNALSGSIPTFLGNLRQLESLDLSRNKLTGEIPRQLTQLNFLSTFSVFENNLTGLIPQGKQFDTFENTSYEGNPGLCGSPLPRKCRNSEALPPLTSGPKKM